MSKGFQDLTGLRVNKLTVVERAANVGKQPAWLCRCDCGNDKIVMGMYLRSASVIDCGCGATARRSAARAVHGMTDTPEFHTWRGMLYRCTNPNSKHWHLYGGRGITVCDRWRESFENFYADMGPRPEGTSLDRKDNDKGYSPDNCRWATPQEQQNNRRGNIHITIDGATKTLKQWAKHYGVPYSVVKARRAAGADGAELFAPMKRRAYGAKHDHNGKSLTLTEWAAELRAPYITVWQRVHLFNKHPDGTPKEQP